MKRVNFKSNMKFYITITNGNDWVAFRGNAVIEKFDYYNVIDFDYDIYDSTIKPLNDERINPFVIYLKKNIKNIIKKASCE